MHQATIHKALTGELRVKQAEQALRSCFWVNAVYKLNTWHSSLFSRQGYDRSGMDRHGYDRSGYNKV